MVIVGAFTDLAHSFDPVLAELIYRWYAPISVLDPYPDPTRAAVASAMGIWYSQEKGETLVMCPTLDDDRTPSWYTGFLGRFLDDVRSCVPLLPPSATAVAVARDARWIDGGLYGFPGHVVEAFAECGMRLRENHALSLPERVDVMMFMRRG